MTKKTHPADAKVLAGIEAAVSFAVHLFQDGETHRVEGLATLDEARAKAAEMAVGAARRPGVYAITSDGSAHLVPPSYKPGAVSAPTDGAKRKAKPKAAKKAAKPKKAKAAKKPGNGTSKTDIAVKLLSRPGGAARKEITEATDWPSINLKAIAKRRKMKLTEKDGMLRMHA